MKSYGQLCAVARALDVVGDRWTLLIVRELLLTPRARYTDLQRGLPGIAPNLLAQRLRELESQGVCRRELAAPPASGILYALTEHGRALEPVVRELLRWGARTIADAPADALFQMHWLAMPASVLLRDNCPDEPLSIVRFGDLADGFDALAASGLVRVTPCDAAASPAATVVGPGPMLIALLQGAVAPAQAIANGVVVDGSLDALCRFLPTSRVDPASIANQIKR